MPGRRTGMSPRSRAATVTLVALALLVAGCAGDPEQAAAPPDETSPTSPSSPTSTAPVGPGAWVDGLPVGPPPAIGYVIGRTYHSAGGRTVRLPRQLHGVSSIARFGDGYLVTSGIGFEGTVGVQRLDADGAPVGPGANMTSAPVLGQGGSTLYWITFTPPEALPQVPTVLHIGDVASGATETITLRRAANTLPSVKGVLGDVIVTNRVPGTAVLVTSTAGSPRRLRALGYAAATSTRGALIAGRTGRSYRHGMVYDYRRSHVLWRARAVVPHSFSPSGRRLLASTRQGFAIVGSRTGRDIVALTDSDPRPARWPFGDPVWEDERHLLAEVVRGRRAAIVRFDVRTGSWELAVDWTPDGGTYSVAFETTR